MELTEEEVLRARAALEHAFVDRAARTMAAHDRPPRGLLEAAGRVLAAALIGVGSGLREGLAKLHDGRPGDIVFGTPVEARAWRALRDHGDAEFFLQVHGHRSGLEAVIDKLDGLADVLADEAAWQDADSHDPSAQEAAAQPRFGDERDGERPRHLRPFSVPELREWADPTPKKRKWRRLREELCSTRSSRRSRSNPTPTSWSVP